MTIEWLEDTSQIERLVEIFITSTSTNYITLTEIREGRAVTSDRWSTALGNHLRAELMQRIPRWQVAVIRDTNGIRGWCSVSRVDSDTCSVDDIVTDGKGYGTPLLEWVENELRGRGYRELTGEIGPTNSGAQGFLQRMGWGEVSRIYRKQLL